MAQHRRTTKEYSYTVLYEPVDKSGYQISVPLLPGLVSFGRTFDEARDMARDAILCYLGALKKDRKRIPLAC
ncbi:MAG: type II toxin-antitoxin system HicB family antitoxin [Candidatus Uhrbacteria bacterium]